MGTVGWLWLSLGILEVFSNLNDSMILCFAKLLVSQAGMLLPLKHNSMQNVLSDSPFCNLRYPNSILDTKMLRFKH